MILPCCLCFISHWGRVMHICFSKLTIIGSDNSLLPGRVKAIIWTSAGILLIGPLGTNFSEILIKIKIFSFKKMHWKMSAKWHPFCISLTVFSGLHARFQLLCLCFHHPVAYSIYIIVKLHLRPKFYWEIDNLNSEVSYMPSSFRPSSLNWHHIYSTLLM